MLLRSTNKTTNFRGFDQNHISEAFRTDFINKSMLLRSQTKPQFLSIRGRFDQTSFFMRGVIVPPSKLIVTTNCPPKVFLLLGAVNYEGGRSNQKSSFMRGVIVPPSQLTVTYFSPKSVFCILLGGLLLRGEEITNVIITTVFTNYYYLLLSLLLLVL